MHLLQTVASQKPDWVVMKTDAKNAFNSVSRQRSLDLVGELFPSLYPFVALCYASPPLLVTTINRENGEMSYHCIESQEGVQQGDPLGPFLFSLTLQSCLVNAHAGMRSGLVASYLDDAVISGPVQDVTTAFDTLTDQMEGIGLVMRRDKCEAFSADPTLTWPVSNVSFSSSGIVILGCPVGIDSFVKSTCQEIVAKEKEFLTRLKQLKNMQSASLLLRYCGTGRISHLLRSIAPSLLHSAARFHDENISACLQSLIGCELRETQVLQAQLRLSQGGLGLSSAQVTSHCAYLASWASTFDQLPSRLLQFRSDSLGLSFEPTPAFMSGEVNSVHEFLCNNCPEVAKLYPTWESVLLKPAKLQKKLSHLLSREDYGNLMAAVDQRSKARILSASSSEAGVWLDTIPAERQLSFTNAEFQTAVALRLGVPIPLLREVRQCTCGAQPDAEGYHLITCRQGGGATRRHDAITYAWVSMLRSVGYRCAV